MTEHLNTPVVTIPLMVTIGTGTNAGYVDFAINPEDLNPPDEEFWKDKEGFEWVCPHKSPSYVIWEKRLGETCCLDNPPTKAHAKMLIHFLTGRTDLWNPPKDRPTMPTDGQGGETT